MMLSENKDSAFLETVTNPGLLRTRRLVKAAKKLAKKQ
jgi:hypothetical protein